MRIARCIAPQVVYHVISRFVDRDLVLRDLEERAKYLHYLERALGQSDWQCISYALMSSHIHLGMIAGEQPMWTWLKRIHSPFARWINKRQGRLGSLFADRPKAWAVRPENVGSLIAYIHNNPVRAGVVREASESRWTSHTAYTAAEPPTWLAIEQGLQLGNVDTDSFDRLVAAADTAEPDAPLGGIHREARKRGALELATPTANPTVVPLVARPFARVRPDPRDVIAAVADVTQVRTTQISSRQASPSIRAARRASVHAARALGLSASDIGAALGLSRQAAARILRKPIAEIESAIVAVVCARLTTVPPSPPKLARVHGDVR